MKLEEKHAQAIEQLVKAAHEIDAETVKAIILDQSIMDYEAIYITAAASKLETTDCDHLGRLLFDGSTSLWRRREEMGNAIDLHGDVDRVVKELGDCERVVACCLVALICDWSWSASSKLMQRMEYLHDHPERVGNPS